MSITTKTLGILFSPDMSIAVRSLLKTQTRRTSGLERLTERGEFAGMWTKDGREHAIFHDSIADDPAPLYKKAPFSRGDELWVREQHFRRGHWKKNGTTKKGRQKWKFVAESRAVQFHAPDAFRVSMDKERPGKAQWYRRLGRFMPGFAARTRLKVTDVGVERLHAITEAGARAEGVRRALPLISQWRDYEDDGGCFYTARDSFASLWRSINGPDSWTPNPWVWVFTFSVKKL